jgi:hypothetical protein
MRKSRKTVSVRVDAEDYKYLKLAAKYEDVSIADVIGGAVRMYGASNRLRFRIFHLIGPGPIESYEVGVGGGESDDERLICEVATLKAAQKALAEYRKEHGYDPRRFPLEKELKSWTFD